MDIEKKSILFAQLCNAVGFEVNPRQAELLIELNKAIDDKEGAVTLDDLNEIIANVSSKGNLQTIEK